MRSEEHTSELQSLRHLVCRLLLEKKNKLTDDSNPFHRRSKTGSAQTLFAIPLLADLPIKYESVDKNANKRKNPRSLFFFNDTATTEIYTLSLHDALPI